jgi:ribosomal protein S18 acetylase RimI-like enzyme
MIREPTGMTVSIRRACVSDIPYLAHALLEATGGLVEAVYEGVIPGRDTQAIVEHLFSRPGATTAFTNCWVAADGEKVVGSMHAFPADAMGGPDDPLVPGDRARLFEPFAHLHAAGSYYLMALAVDPGFRSRGIGRRLMAEAEAAARSEGFGETSFHVFAENRRAVALYEALGYRERARLPVVGHRKIRYGGDILLMTRAL